MFVDSRDGGRRAAVLCTIIASCKLNGVDQLAYLTDVINKMCTSAGPDKDPSFELDRLGELF